MPGPGETGKGKCKKSLLLSPGPGEMAPLRRLREGPSSARLVRRAIMSLEDEGGQAQVSNR